MTLLAHYLPILIFMGVSLFIAGVALLAGGVFGPRKPNPAKNSPYECGFPALEDARGPFDVRFCLVAILFIVFDLETAFLFPWAVALRKIGHFGFVSMLIFLFVLVIGFIYEWKRGALEWE